MYILHYLVAMLTFKCFLKAEVTKGIDLALNKPAERSDAPANSAGVPSNAVDGRALTCCIAIHFQEPLWITVDLARPRHMGTIYLKFDVVVRYKRDPDYIEEIYLLMMNLFDRRHHQPNPRKNNVCHMFDISVMNYDGNVTCARKRYQPPHRYIAFWMASIRDVNLCTIEVYEECPYDFYGPRCVGHCHCRYGTTCDPDLGKCPDGCMPGYKGDSCDEIDMDAMKIGCLADSGNPEDKLACRDKCYSLDKDMFTYDGAICNCSNFNGADETEMCAGSQYEKFSVCPKRYYGYRCIEWCVCGCESYCGVTDGKCIKVDCGGGSQVAETVKTSNSSWMTLMPLVLVVMVTGFILLVIAFKKRL